MGKLYDLLWSEDSKLIIRYKKEIKLAITPSAIRDTNRAHQRRIDAAIRNATDAELTELVDDMAIAEFLSGVWELLTKGQRRGQLAELKAMRDEFLEIHSRQCHPASIFLH